MSLRKYLERSAVALKQGVESAYTGDFMNRQLDYTVAKVNCRDDLQNWVRGSDRDVGGFSDAYLDTTRHGHAKFHGYISQKLPEDPRFTRSGYAMVRSCQPESHMFGGKYWDSSLFRYLMLRVRADNRKYFVNLKSSTVVQTDIYQHLLPIRTPGRWETVVIPFNEFTLTSNSVIIASQPAMSETEMETVGFSISDRQDGPFCLEFAWIKAVNSMRTFGNTIRLPYTADIVWRSDFAKLDKDL